MDVNIHDYVRALNAVQADNKALLHDPPTEYELHVWDWAKAEIEKAKKEGRKIMFDIPFDYD